MYTHALSEGVIGCQSSGTFSSLFWAGIFHWPITGPSRLVQLSNEFQGICLPPPSQELGFLVGTTRLGHFKKQRFSGTSSSSFAYKAAIQCVFPLLLFFFFFSQERISLYVTLSRVLCRPYWPELTEVYLPMPLKYWDVLPSSSTFFVIDYKYQSEMYIICINVDSSH